MSTIGKLQAKLAELLQINEAMVTHIESLVAERDYFKNGMAELQDIIDKLEPERDALVAQVEVLREVANDAIHFATKRKDKVCADPMFVMQQLQERIDETPQQCLREIQAEAGRAGFVAGAEMWSDYGVKSRYKDDYLVDIEADASKYAEKVRNGE